MCCLYIDVLVVVLWLCLTAPRRSCLESHGFDSFWTPEL